METRRHVLLAGFGVMVPVGILAVVLAGSGDRWDDERVLAAGVLLAVLAGVLAFVALRLATRTPRRVAQAVTERARAVATGHIGRHEPVPVKGPPPVRAMAGAFNDMVERVRVTVEALEDSRSAFRRAAARLGDVLDSTHDPATITAAVVETARSVVDGRTAVHWSLRTDRLVPEAVDGEPRATAPLAAGRGLAGAALTAGAPLLGEQQRRDPGEPSDAEALAVPLLVAGEVRGVIAVYGRNGPPLPFSADDLAAVATLARQAQTALENVRLHDEATHLSLTDPLTGLPNRRELDRRLVAEIERSARFGEPFSLVLLDIDDFKAVNDAHGHPAGDAVLVELGRRLRRSTREVDTVARVGGEELAVLLPKATVVAAATAAIRMRKDVASTPFRIGEGADCLLSVTCSFGVASHPEHGATVDGLWVAADRALYRAKRAGKNRVERAEGAGAPGAEEDPPPP